MRVRPLRRNERASAAFVGALGFVAHRSRGARNGLDSSNSIESVASVRSRQLLLCLQAVARGGGRFEKGEGMPGRGPRLPESRASSSRCM